MPGARYRLFFYCLVFILTLVPLLRAEDCYTGNDIDPTTKAALERTAGQYFDMAARGDFASLKQSAIPGLASNFGSVESAISDNKANLQGAQATIRSLFLLRASGNATLSRAEFFCGIFNSPDRTGFQINNLAPGTYGIVVQDVQGGKAPFALSFILQQMQGQWKLGGFYARATQIAGHDSAWFLGQARQYKAAGKTHNAWFYYLTAWDLEAPLPFMGTAALDKIADEMQSTRPADLPPAAQLQLTGNGKTYKISDVFAAPVPTGLDLVVKYPSPDISNSQQTFADNMAVISAIVARYPEFREAFVGVVARAVAPGGSDYGSELPMKNIK